MTASAIDGERVQLAVTRSVSVLGTDDKPALELESTETGDVKVAVLPRNGSRRMPVRLADLKAAVEALAP